METTFPLLPTVVGLLMCISSHASDPAVVMFVLIQSGRVGCLLQNKLTQLVFWDQLCS